jgi:hypothetical protein
MRHHSQAAQARTLEAMLAIVILFFAAAMPRFAQTQPNPSQSPQAVLDYLVYSGTLQTQLRNPQQLIQTVSLYTAQKSWTLQVYTYQNGEPKPVLLVTHGALTQANPAEAIIYAPNLTIVYFAET